MLSKEQRENTKNEILSLLRSVSRKDYKIDELIDALESNNFFESPASTEYHGSEPGGLAEHSLNVFYNLMHLVKYKGLEETISEDSIIICSLLHDISKAGNYEIYYKNYKEYNQNGSRSDEGGKFDWKTKPTYKISDSRFIFGNHEMTSEFLVRQFVPLTVQESVAILHHMGGLSWDSAKDNISEIYQTYPLALLLHESDMLATFIDENI